MKQLAIIGPTASGKTALSIEFAQKNNCYILSLDSLSVYKEIDIASAKPTLEERAGIPHFGIDEFYPDQKFSVMDYFDIYKKAKKACMQDKKNLVIVGGSSFYLKSMLDGITKNPNITDEIKKKAKEITKDLSKAYSFIKENDKLYSQKISKSDRYRIEKWYEIFLATNQIPEEYFKRIPKIKAFEDIKIYNLNIDKEILKLKIKKRTSIMIEQGLIDEVFFLDKKYGRNQHPFNSIGIKETYDYLDGKLDIQGLEEQISLNTYHLAKRQITFNKTQFNSKIKDIKSSLKNNISF